jgi:hypothetical protein
LNQSIHGSSFLFPRSVDSANPGPEGAKNPAGVNVLRLIQIRLTTVECGKDPARLSTKKNATPTRRFNLHKSSQHFIPAHDETLSVAAMCKDARRGGDRVVFRIQRGPSQASARRRVVSTVAFL